MHRKGFVLLSAFLIAMSATLIANDKPSPEYQKAMKDLGGVAAAMGKPGATEDFEAAKKHATSAKDAFSVVQKYWATKNPDAAKLADTGSKAASDLLVVSGMSSTEGIEAAMKDMMATCGACHMAHREKTADGFEIK